MDVTSTTSVTTRTSSGGPTMSGSTDYQTFLTMLTTQLKNQDPTAPMESTDFAVQLATFSGVEQQTMTNQLLERMGGKMDAMTLSDLSSWLGAQARVSAPVTVDGSPVTLYPQFDAKADKAVLVVKDATGNTVSRNALDPAAKTLDWTPADATGAPLTSGRYVLSVENYAGDTPLSITPVQHYATVTEAKIGPKGTMLVLEDGSEVAASDVTSLKR